MVKLLVDTEHFRMNTRMRMKEEALESLIELEDIIKELAEKSCFNDCYEECVELADEHIKAIRAGIKA